MKTTTKLTDLQREAAALAAVEHMIETNDGTFSQQEACRAVGTADPAYATRRVYESVGGVRRETGPSEDRAPGRTRSLNRDALSADRRRLADLRKQIAAAR